MRLGKHEKKLLHEIETTPGDVLVGFLCSARSVSRMYKVAHQRARNRAETAQRKYDLQQRRKRMIKKLEKKGLITLHPREHDCLVVLSDQAQEYTAIERLVRNKLEVGPWDGNWTLVMFDIPVQKNSIRVQMSHLLQKIGFVPVQLSVYAFPYKVPELEAFVRQNKKYREYCHIFRGSYQGDDSGLRKKFNLP